MASIPRAGPGIPPGVIAPILEAIRRSPGPIKRRALLEALEKRGHRISLAGLNRALQFCRESGLTVESDQGIRLAPGEDPARAEEGR